MLPVAELKLTLIIEFSDLKTGGSHFQLGLDPRLRECDQEIVFCFLVSSPHFWPLSLLHICFIPRQIFPLKYKRVSANPRAEPFLMSVRKGRASLVPLIEKEACLPLKTQEMSLIGFYTISEPICIQRIGILWFLWANQVCGRVN